MPGLSSSGFLALRLAEVLAELRIRWRAEFGANTDLSADSPDGQIVGILAEREAALWEQLTLLYASAGLDSATGAALDEHAALAAITRLAASSSTVTLTAAGTPATVLAAGRRVVLDDSGTIWELAGATIGGGGTVDVLATAVETGPLPALSGSDWTIQTPVTGWTGVTNALDADVGRSAESDEALRQRVRSNFVAAGAPSDGIRGAIARLADVDEVIVAQNVTSAVDAEGRPPHSFEAIVRGGDDDAIAQAIWNTKPHGIEAYSESGDSGTATTVLGGTEVVPFTRPTEIPVWIEADVEIDPARYPVDGDALVAAEILAHEAVLTMGVDVVPFAIIQGIETPGIVSLVMRVGRAVNPAATVPLAMATREIATLDSSRITVARV